MNYLTTLTCSTRFSNLCSSTYQAGYAFSPLQQLKLIWLFQLVQPAEIDLGNLWSSVVFSGFSVVLLTGKIVNQRRYLNAQIDRSISVAWSASDDQTALTGSIEKKCITNFISLTAQSGQSGWNG